MNESSASAGLIFDIRRFSLHDGPGIRTTVFFKGCPLQCSWCHNPESRNPWCESYDVERPVNGDVVREAVSIGTTMTPEEVMDQVARDIVFMDLSGGGVTFSGGEPLLQPEFLHLLLNACREKGIHTALDTCGHVSTDVFSRVLDKADLFLYDLKLIDADQHRKYTGESNALVLENLRTLVRRGNRVIVRIPVIASINDSDENIGATARFLRFLDRIERIDLLPFHNLARHKYRRLRLPEPEEGLSPPPPERLEELKRLFEREGFHVTIGGLS